MRKSLLFVLLSLVIAFSFAFSLPKVTLALCDPGDSVCKQLEEFDRRRSGDQMNLETWYSGKKTTTADDPASIGFSSIVLFDLYNRLSGANATDFSDPAKVIQMLIGSNQRGEPVAKLPDRPLQNSGLVSQISTGLGLAFSSPPVSFTSYLASVRENIGRHSIVQPAYAQNTGYGFQNLLPILPVWKAFRNVAYFVFVLVFVLYGFMVMFRMKINPQNVASFQTAIPKIVTTLLVITFAYAIAGFMIDLMYVVFNLILSVFVVSGLISTPDNFWVSLGSGQYGVLASWFFSTFIAFFFVPAALINVLTQLPGGISTIIDILLSVVGLGLIIRLIIIIAVAYSFVKLIFKLFEAYISIIIQVIFSPIILLQDVMPGSQAFGNWLRGIVANLSVFPVTMIMLLLSYIFMIQPLLRWTGGGGISGVQSLYEQGAGFRMPLIGGVGTGLGANVNSAGILATIGFFILLMASKYVDMVKDALKVPPFKYGGALSEALNYGMGQFTNTRSMYNKAFGGRLATGVAGVNETMTGVTESVASRATGRTVVLPKTDEYRDKIRSANTQLGAK